MAWGGVDLLGSDAACDWRGVFGGSLGRSEWWRRASTATATPTLGFSDLLPLLVPAILSNLLSSAPLLF